MSTKFSIRPAVRKKPWICKRSPPCLIPPPYPLCLIASFRLQRMLPAPPETPYQGSCLIYWSAPPRIYTGRWTNGLDWVDVRFSYDPITGEASAWTDFELNAFLWWGWYEPVIIPLPPLLLYHQFAIQTPGMLYRGELQVTG